MGDDLTRAGHKMSRLIRERIIEAMTNPLLDGAKQLEVAQAARVSERTLRNYLTESVWDEIRQRRLEVVHNAVGAVDKAILQRALQGDVQAAKLLYSRWEKMQALADNEPVKTPATLDELDEEIRRIEKEIRSLTVDPSE